MELSVMVKDCVAPAAMLTLEKVTLMTRPFAVCGEAAAATTVGVVTIPEAVPDNVRFPVVAVMPVPAVTVVAALTLPAVETKFPVVAVIFPVVAVMPVPAVTVVAALTLPAVETKFPVVAVMLPVVAVNPVPPVTVVAALTLPAVETIFPVVAVIFPVVAVIPVPAVIVVPDERDVPAEMEVVEEKDPGAVKITGKLRVIVAPDPTVVIWLLVPAILILPDDGVAVPVVPVRLFKILLPPVNAVKLLAPE